MVTEAPEPATSTPAASTNLLVVPLLDRLVGDVRGALIGLVLGLCTAVLTLSGVIWHNHLTSESAVNLAQDKRADSILIEQAKVDAGQQQESQKLWAALAETVAKWEKETEAYRAQQSAQLTKRVEFEARSLAIMERLDEDGKEMRAELRSRKR